jgi:hopanoid-associated phosphorylase
MILAVTGMTREVEILSSPGVTIIAGGLQPQRLRSDLQNAARGAQGIISIGIAGALDPAFRAGDTIVAASVVSGRARYAVDLAWMQRIAARLPKAVVAPILGQDKLVSDKREKARLFAQYSVPAVDMESHIAAEAAAARNLPFAALRVVCDGAHDSLPHAARNAVAPDGNIALATVLRGLLLRPYEIASLIKLGLNSRTAFAELLRCRDRLGAGLCGLG